MGPLRALKALGRECDSFARLGGGLTAWLLGVAGSAGLGAVLWDGLAAPLRLLALAAGPVLLAGGALLGTRVWRAGRVVVDAFCWWTLLPEKLPAGGAGVEGWRAAPVADAVHARVFIFQGWRPLRIALSAIAFLVPITWGDQLDRDVPALLEGQTGALWVSSLLLFAVSWSASAIVMGGQFRASRAHSQRDPVQRKLLGR